MIRDKRKVKGLDGGVGSTKKWGACFEIHCRKFEDGITWQ